MNRTMNRLHSTILLTIFTILVPIQITFIHGFTPFSPSILKPIRLFTLKNTHLEDTATSGNMHKRTILGRGDVRVFLGRKNRPIHAITTAPMYTQLSNARNYYENDEYDDFEYEKEENMRKRRRRKKERDGPNANTYKDDDFYYEYTSPRSEIGNARIPSKEEQELRNLKYEVDEEEEDEEEDYYYETDNYSSSTNNRKRDRREDWVTKSDKYDSIQETGNFWSNPKGSLDDYDRNARRRPRQAQYKKTRSISYSYDDYEYDDDYDDDYEVDDDYRNRIKGSQRKTFRSGNPPPPNILKEFYNQLFWYGFDPEETTSTSDSRTMFGGTKGKFNGLGLLGDIQAQQRDDQGDSRDRRRRFDERDYYYDDDDEEEDDDMMEEEYEEEYYYYDNSRNGNMKARSTTKRQYSNDKNDDDDYYVEIDFDDDYDYEYEYEQRRDGSMDVAARKDSQKRKNSDPTLTGSNSLLPPSQSMSSTSLDDSSSTSEMNYYEDENQDDFENGRYTSSYREERSQKFYARRQSPRESNNGTARRKQVRRKSIDNDYEPRNSRKKRRDLSITSSWFEEDENEGRKVKKENKRGNNRNNDETSSPIINLLDAVFQVDPEEVKYQADDYNRKLGLGKRNNDEKPRGKGRFSEYNEVTMRRRKGYAYRYSPEDDDYYSNKDDDEGAAENAERGFKTKKNDNFDAGGDQTNSTGTNESQDIDPNIIDVEATVQHESSKSQTERKDGRQMKQQSWEERAQAYEQVPPSNIKAWGPDGVIDDGIDIRSYAARSALEEINKARKIFERKEEMVNNAENDLIQLKRDANTLKKRLLSRENRNRSSSIRDRLRMINFDIEDSARKLRRNKGEALAAIDKLEALELRHWALLRQHEADQKLTKENSKATNDDVTKSEDEELSSSVVNENAKNQDKYSE